MREHYDFARMKGRRNPYARLLKRCVTIRLDDSTVAYFKELATETGVAYQSLINLYLRDCVVHRRRLEQRWVADDVGRLEDDARFVARIEQVRESIRAGKAVPWDEVKELTEPEETEFRVSDRPAARSPRRRSRK